MQCIPFRIGRGCCKCPVCPKERGPGHVAYFCLFTFGNEGGLVPENTYKENKTRKNLKCIKSIIKFSGLNSDENDRKLMCEGIHS